MTSNRNNPTNPCQKFLVFFMGALTSAGLAVSPTCMKPSIWQVGCQFSPGTADDDTMVELG